MCVCGGLLFVCGECGLCVCVRVCVWCVWDGFASVVCVCVCDVCVCIVCVM